MTPVCNHLLSTLYGSITRALFIQLGAYTSGFTVAELIPALRSERDRLAHSLNHPYVNHGPSPLETGIIRFQLAIILEALQQASQFTPEDAAKTLSESVLTRMTKTSSELHLDADGRVVRTPPT